VFGTKGLECEDRLTHTGFMTSSQIRAWEKCCECRRGLP